MQNKYKKQVILFIGIILFSNLILAEQIVFNGEWKEGTTLYSNRYNGISELYGTDVYPIRNMQYCENQQKCINWNYHYEKTCLRFNQRGKCISWKSIKILDDCKTYQTINICKSTKSYPAICYNQNELPTNQLTLKENFFYSIDGINWIQVKYGYTYFNNMSAIFKVNIPNICKPNYNINQAITYE